MLIPIRPCGALDVRGQTQKHMLIKYIDFNELRRNDFDPDKAGGVNPGQLSDPENCGDFEGQEHR